MTSSTSYREAGVDTAAGDRAVELMKAAVAKTHGPEVFGGFGGFAGLFDASALTAFRRPLLATSTDGVGTKVAIAQAIDKHDTIGQDLVGMVVDDIVVVGAKPLFMTDYIACGKVHPERIASIVSGIAQACSDTGTALIGGETAEHPGLLGVDDYDVAGAATGAVEADAILGEHRVAGRRRRPRTRVLGPALERLLARAAHPRPGGHRLRRPQRRPRHDVRRGPPRADAALHPAPPAAARRPGLRGGRPLAQPRHRRRDRRQPRARPAQGLLGRGRPLHLEPVAGVPDAERAGRSSLESSEGTWNLGIGFFAVVSPAVADGVTAALEADGIPTWQVGTVHLGDDAADLSAFEQGAKGVDGGAVRLVGAYRD